jgi:hypothetical protein
MKLWDYVLIVVVTTMFLFYFLYKRYKQQQNNKKTQQEKEYQYYLQNLQQKLINEEINKELERNYKLNTHKVQYSLFNPIYDGLHDFNSIYELIIHDNLWINEPFHTKFYEFCMIINNNDFMIIDPYSKVITMNIRDKYNKVQTSKSYQVYCTKEIIMHAIRYCITDIKIYNKNEAQNLLISIFVLALKQSVHYLSPEATQNIVDKVLEGYEFAQEIRDIVLLIEEKDSQFYFIQESIYNAFPMVETLPYNDSEVPKAVEIRQQQPLKLLQKI